MSNTYTTEDFKKAIAQMEDEDLPLDAPVEVSIGDKIYNVTGIGHFHIMPNMVISLELKEDV